MIRVKHQKTEIAIQHLIRHLPKSHNQGPVVYTPYHVAVLDALASCIFAIEC